MSPDTSHVVGEIAVPLVTAALAFVPAAWSALRRLRIRFYLVKE